MTPVGSALRPRSSLRDAVTGRFAGRGNPLIGFTCPHCGEPVIPEITTRIQLGRMAIDTAVRDVWVDGERRHIPAGQTWLVLIAMAQQPGRLFTHDNLMDIANIWESSSNHLAVILSKIRHVLGDVIEIRFHKFMGYSMHARGEVAA